ncbi:MAG: SNF2-related protein [Pseudomonadota bacterium]
MGAEVRARMFSQHQSLYFAHWLTLAGRSQREVSIKMGAAKVDMNPHQIDAALFALKSPVEKGVLLADEVGLGKTIEAGLVMAQRWAENNRKILLVAPASLRKQWAQELEDKFELPSIILDSQVAKVEFAAGRTNPFDQQEKIVICSYEYVSRRKDRVQDVRWDLVVFDEAHKLRNLYKKDGNTTAKNIHQATLHAESKILLSATPIQNNLMELYGLVKMIDDHFFGDEDTFRVLYVNRRKSRSVLKELSQRIEPIYHRTLRRQVQQEGGINFTNRYSMTEDFTPHDDEWDLYEKISDYLQRDDLKAMAPNARHLVTIGMRKILASSSFAIVDTLQKIIDRLESDERLDEAVLSDMEDADDWRDSFDESEDEANTGGALLDELNELKNYKALAERISRNAKGDALLKVIGKAFDMIENLGAQRKAVVFTESRRTQRYIAELLENNGFANRVVMLNGSNTDARSKEIYNQWKARHSGGARITGSKTADMKAALVEHFASDAADILISTEAGGEGINLQFCSLLINYDLPWNPQKVEQRIGRVHRYGQKYDVVIVNFINRRNDADNRVFKLLDEKFQLFEGVFGASDEILGAIVSSDIDIERRIYDIYQKCRTPEAITEAFDRLDEDVLKAREVREKKTIQTLMQTLDIEVVRRLKSQRENSALLLDEYQQMLLNFARAELSEARFSQKHFTYNNTRYDLDWAQAQQHDSEFFRLQAVEHRLAWDLVKMVKSRELPVDSAQQLVFNLSELPGQHAALESYIGQGGLLQVKKLTYHYASITEEHLLIAAQTSSGSELPSRIAEKLLTVPAKLQAINRPVSGIDLDPLFETLLDQKKIETEAKLQEFFEKENTKLERWADDRRRALEMEVKELDSQIRDMKKAARGLANLQEKIDARRRIKHKETERDNAMVAYQQAKKKIEADEDKLLDDIEAKLTPRHEIEALFCVPWTLTADR